MEVNLIRDPIKQAKRRHEHYLRNKNRFFGAQRQRRKTAKLHVLNIKQQSGGCVCGEKHPALLDFHHRNPDEKELTAAKMIQNKWSPERIDKELEKCDILCANCHRRFHWEQDNLNNIDGYNIE